MLKLAASSAFPLVSFPGLAKGVPIQTTTRCLTWYVNQKRIRGLFRSEETHTRTEYAKNSWGSMRNHEL